MLGWMDKGNDFELKKWYAHRVFLPYIAKTRNDEAFSDTVGTRRVASIHIKKRRTIIDSPPSLRCHPHEV